MALPRGILWNVTEPLALHDGASEQERCAVHPERGAAVTCGRCGSFACEACTVEVDDARWACVECAKLPGVDYLGHVKRAHWGRRDSYVWFIGGLWTFTGGLAALQDVLVLFAQPSVATMIDLALVGVGLALTVSYLLLRPWSRVAVFAMPIVVALRVSQFQGVDRAGSLFAVVLIALVTAGAFFSKVNRLAFKLEVDRAGLRKIFALQADRANKASGTGFMLAMLSLVVPGVALLALFYCVRGLRRVDPRAWPPVAGRGYAIAGIVLACLGLATSALIVYGVVT